MNPEGFFLLIHVDFSFLFFSFFFFLAEYKNRPKDLPSHKVTARILPTLKYLLQIYHNPHWHQLTLTHLNTYHIRGILWGMVEKNWSLLRRDIPLRVRCKEESTQMHICGGYILTWSKQWIKFMKQTSTESVPRVEVGSVGKRRSRWGVSVSLKKYSIPQTEMPGDSRST